MRHRQFLGIIVALCLVAACSSSNNDAALQEALERIESLENEKSGSTSSVKTEPEPAPKTSTTTRVVTTTGKSSSASKSGLTQPKPAIFTENQKKALNKLCAGSGIDCYDFVGEATKWDFGISTGSSVCASLGEDAWTKKDICPEPKPRRCSYSEVKEWIKEEKFNDPEWPLFIEKECGR